MADEIREAFGVETELKKGDNGVFDVVVDGRLVYSKYETGRHAEPGEVVGLIQGG